VFILLKAADACCKTVEIDNKQIDQRWGESHSSRLDRVYLVF